MSRRTATLIGLLIITSAVYARQLKSEQESTEYVEADHYAAYTNTTTAIGIIEAHSVNIGFTIYSNRPTCYLKVQDRTEGQGIYTVWVATNAPVRVTIGTNVVHEAVGRMTAAEQEGGAE